MAQNERTFNKNNLGEGQGGAFFSRMMEKGEHLEEELKKYGDTLDVYIKKNPVKSTVIAGVAGLLLGKFLSR
jgi:ElaB/YqjD/DUF883 family membrane-anchored ribosome-binding protein